ncbi:MAG TPA: polyprenyl synthetase family protein [Candidatus Saccharimonadales bacterium]|nr:polyprenyl synthetase family protein [Candidatus Saccharimonadales bacterium]
MKEVLRYAPGIKRELHAAIDARQTGSRADSPWEDDFLQRLGVFAAKGKLLRGSLTCFAYEKFSGTPPSKPVLQTAAALELVHSALLIHDDIMDNDDLRRGQPSLHNQYQAAAKDKKLSEPARFGINMALAGGDMAFFLAFDLLATLDLEARKLATIKKMFVDQLVVVCAGQMQDVYFDANLKLPPKREIYKLMEEKTASYTIALPLLLGATLAGANKATLRQLSHLGVAAGTVFQIRDDELGLMGTTDKIGKPVGSDIAEGKKTLLYYYLFRRCNSAERKQLLSLFGSAHITDSDIAYLQQLVRKRGVLQLLQADVDRLTRQAYHAIALLPLSAKTKEELHELVVFCAQRQA